MGNKTSPAPDSAARSPVGEGKILASTLLNLKEYARLLTTSHVAAPALDVARRESSERQRPTRQLVPFPLQTRNSTERYPNLTFQSKSNSGS